MRFKMPRESYIPKHSSKVADKLSDAVAYLWQSGKGKPGATIFFGKQAKPVSNYFYRDDVRRQAAIAEAFEGRRKSLAFKAGLRKERLDWVPDYKVGEILHTCWGYDQTNVEFFEVTEVRGKHVILREIAQAIVDTGWCTGRCAPLKGEYLSPRYEGDDRGVPIRRLAQKHGIKIDNVRTAFRETPKKIGGVDVHQSHRWSSYA